MKYFLWAFFEVLQFSQMNDPLVKFFWFYNQAHEWHHDLNKYYDFNVRLMNNQSINPF